MTTPRPSKNVNEFINLILANKQNYKIESSKEVPVVSIISSFYNADKYFEQCYSCLANQNFQEFEWIIVNDGSTDKNALELFDSLPERDSRIKTVHHQVNNGVSAGRNTAVSYAKGKYLFFLDLDDLLDPTYIEKCVLFLESHPEISLVNSYSVGFQEQEYWWSHGFEKVSDFIEQNWLTVMLMYRKEDFVKLGGFDESLRFYEDWERWLRAIVNQQKCWTIPEYLHCYRRSNSGLLLTSINNTLQKNQATDLIQSRYKQFFKDNNIQNTYLKRPSAFEVDLQSYNFSINNYVGNRQTRKRILCFFPWLEVGGADKFNLDLVTLLSERGYDITITTTLKSEHPWHHHFYQVTYDIFHLNNFLHYTYFLAFARYLIKSRQIDIVFISNSYIAYYLVPLLKVEFPNVVFIDYVHTGDPGWRKCGYPRISCQLNQFLDCQVVSSKHLLNFYKNLHPETESKLRVCYTNEDTQKWTRNQEKGKKLRDQLRIDEHNVILLYPARIVGQKRPLLLVDIVQELVSKSLPISVIVLGQGELLSQMQAKITQLGLESVFHILPPCEPEQMIDFYSASDILLLPSEYEGLSLAIYEAMSMQLPIVASDVGGQSELVIPGTGFLIPKGNGDANEIKAYIEVLMPLIQDSVLRDKVGFAARQRIQESFCLEAMGDRMESIFAEAIANNQTKPKISINPDIAEEMLRLGLEYLHQEQVLNDIWQEKCQIEQENKALWLEKCQIEQENKALWLEKCQIEQEKNVLFSRKNAMETSKFWQLRKLWFKFKRKLRLTDEEP
ncbi:glycosyltransferase [Nostoc sp. PCC 7524]|uniref:glycosyltransferase n=1 Tax=Nostoc sp. (strain ATCC 29411 / PCC 7524) TaxID=28072 RepID=UPI00029F2026|nr:glycosyltransferase [Nostoc sp. PCC 7524]AFY48357.1 glycosyltransferase [Nostoc sp. PCC 7524]